jgi:hypothetical protein
MDKVESTRTANRQACRRACGAKRPFILRNVHSCCTVAGRRPKGEMVRATVTFEMEFEMLVPASGVIPHSSEAHSWCSSGDWTGPKGASAWESRKEREPLGAPLRE